MRLKTRAVATLLCPVTGPICICHYFTCVAGHPQNKIQSTSVPSYIDLHVGVNSKHWFLFHCLLEYLGFKEEWLL